MHANGHELANGNASQMQADQSIKLREDNFVIFDHYRKINLNFDIIKPFIDRKQLLLEDQRLFWFADYETLTIFAETIGFVGKWSSPGGRVKKFVDKNVDLTLTWYYGKKGSLFLLGECAETCKETLANVWKSYVDRIVIQTISEVSAVTASEADSIVVSDQSPINVKNATFPDPLTRDCKCFENGVELDGVKFDIVIMQKKLDFISEKLSGLENRSSQSGVGKSAASKFDLILDKKNREIESQSKVIESLQQKLAIIQKERDFLRSIKIY